MGITKLDWGVDYKNRAMHVPSKKDSPIFKKAFYFINQTGKRCFYIVTPKRDVVSITKLTSLSYTYNDNNSTLEVMCSDSEFHETFEILFMETFELMHQYEISFYASYEKVLAKYNAFLQGQLHLPIIKQIGLLNELVILKMIILIEPSGMKHWHDMDEDFKFGNKFVEVKATRSKLHKHIINGLAQLTVPLKTSKYFISTLVTELDKQSTESSINLYDITEEIFEIIPNAEKPIFLKRISDRGYFHELNGIEYKAFNFDFYEMKFIRVDESFPCINLTTLNESLYRCIDPQNIQYELNIQSLSGSLECVSEDFIQELLDY